MTKLIKDSLGFTLVEIMIAVSILAILTSIGLVVFTGQEQKAKVAKVQEDMNAISLQIQLARQVQNKTLNEITGGSGDFGSAANNYSWSDRDCRSNSPAHPSNMKVMDRLDCVTMIQNNWTKITGKSSYIAQPLPLDPWGSIYMFDENEHTQFTLNGVIYSCRWDMLRSAGPDQIAWTFDDYYLFVPPFQCTTHDFVPGEGTMGTRLY